MHTQLKISQITWTEKRGPSTKMMAELEHNPRRNFGQTNNSWYLFYTAKGVRGKMVTCGEDDQERLVKSADRVRDLGEVFTPSATVVEMLDLLPKSIWKVHPSPTFLEPACGDGNFLVAILERKLEQVAKAYSSKNLLAGDSIESAQFHALEALSSIYAVDISKDNVVGGTKGHEIGARTRLVNFFTGWNFDNLGKNLTEQSPIWKSAVWIVEHNLIIGNMLAIDANGQPTKRDSLPLFDYEWLPESRSLSLCVTTLGAVMETEAAESSSIMSLFAPAPAKHVWRGKAALLHEVDRVFAPKMSGPVRNGTERSRR
jgi:hypothetical protein